MGVKRENDQTDGDMFSTFDPIAAPGRTGDSFFFLNQNLSYRDLERNVDKIICLNDFTSGATSSLQFDY